LLGVALMKVRSIIRKEDQTGKTSAEINGTDFEADRKSVDLCRKHSDTNDEGQKEATDEVADETKSEEKSSGSASEKRSKRLKKTSKRSGSKGRRKKNMKITDWM